MSSLEHKNKHTVLSVSSNSNDGFNANLDGRSELTNYEEKLLGRSKRRKKFYSKVGLSSWEEYNFLNERGCVRPPINYEFILLPTGIV